MDRRAAGALLALAACIASSAAAPTANNQTALDLYDAASEGCYYNFQHYGEGDRIMTNEPCLNCTCHNRMLMCYLRVCPFTKPIGQDCTVEKRADQCCPIVTCPDVPVDLLTSTSTSSPAEYGATGLGKLDKYGCSINDKYFPEGSKVPPTPNKPCEHCYCIRNMTTCVMQECTLHVDGCTPIYHKDVCCPVRYSCDHPEDEMPLLDDMSTTVRPTPGFLLTTTTLSPMTTQMTQDCVHNDQIFPDGTSIKTEKACEHCYCMKGDIVCVVQECGTPMENEGKNCTSQPPREGQCCPDTYICEGDDVTTELLIDYTTEPFIEELTTLSPPQRVPEEGSGFRKEEKRPIGTELPYIEPDIEGSGEDFATIQPSETEKQTPDLFDERFSSTEDVIGMGTTPQSVSEVEKATKEPDSELNTVPSGTVEPSETFVPKLTTVSEEPITTVNMEPTHADNNYTTPSLDKKEEVSAQTTESAFRKEDNFHVPVDTTTEKGSQDHTTLVFEPTIDAKDETADTTAEQTPFTTISEANESTTPALSEFSQTASITDAPTTTASDKTSTEPSVSIDHTVDESPSTVFSDKTETTTLNAQENEIEDVSTTQGPGRIPGEGDCLQNGQTYRNESAVPSSNNCQTDCKCVSSIIKCDPIICSSPPEYMSNCVPTYDSSESCCPTYVCDGSKETLPPQPHSQMSETTSSTPAVGCHGDQCDTVDKSPVPIPTNDCNSGDCMAKPSNIPENSDCGSNGCAIVQTPVQIEVQPDCGSEGCTGGDQLVLHEISPIPTESCSDTECQQTPIKKDELPQPCDGENCKTSSQPCQNEEECKSINIPKDQSPCEGESCKTIPTDCSDDGCKLPSEPCQGEMCISKDKQDSDCVGEDCKNTVFPDITGEMPSECHGDDCLSQPDNTEMSGTESPMSQDKDTKIPSATTEYLLPETTPRLEQEEIDTQTSNQIEQETTEKGTEVTYLDDTQTSTPQLNAEEPLHDSDETVKNTDKPSTDIPEIQTTEYVQTKESTSELPTSKEQELEMSSPESVQEDVNASETTKIDDSVTITPETIKTTESLEQNEAVTEESKLPKEEGLTKPDDVTEKISDSEDSSQTPTLSSETKLESEVTEPTVHDIPVQAETEGIHEFTNIPETSDISSPDERFTKEPELGSGEVTTESFIKPTEVSVSDDKLDETEAHNESEETSEAPAKPAEVDVKITTTLPELIEMTTEEKLLDISPTISSSATDESTALHDTQTDVPDLQSQEPVIPTTSTPQTHIDSDEPNKQDDDTIVNPDIDLNSTQDPILSETSTSETEKPIYTEKEPEESFTEQPEINTEEPTFVTQQEEVVPQEPMEPDSVDFIPVHPTEGDKLESDLIDKQTSLDSTSATTEQKLQSTTTESITIVESELDSTTLESDASSKPGVMEEEYDQDRKTTEASLEILPTDNRKYNQDSTEVPEPVTQISEQTTKPTEEISTKHPQYSEPSTSKTSAEESSATQPSESFSTEKLEVIPTETPESHVKETESDAKLTSPEITTEKLIKSEEPETVLEPKPTESNLPFTEVDKEKPEHDLEIFTQKSPEQTTEPKFEFSETTPDMIELVEHNEMHSPSTPTLISDEITTISSEIEKDDKLTSGDVSPAAEKDYDKTTTYYPLLEDIDNKIKDETASKEPDVTKVETTPVHTFDDDELATLQPETDMGQMEPEMIPVLVPSTEIVETHKDYSTTRPDISDLVPQTEKSEDTQTERTEKPDSDMVTTKQSEQPVTEFVEPEVEFTTVKESYGEIEVDEIYSTEKPEDEPVSTSKPEYSTVVSEEPSIVQEPITDKTKEQVDENEVAPEDENTKSTATPEVVKDIIPETNDATRQPEILYTEKETTTVKDIATDSPFISGSVKEPDMESSTEQKLLPEQEIVTDRPEPPITEKEIPVTEDIDKESESTETPEVESSTNSSESPIAVDESLSQTSTNAPDFVKPEQSTTTTEETPIKPSLTSEPEKVTESPESSENTKPDDVSTSTFVEKELSTEKSETELDTNKETPIEKLDTSGIENEITSQTTTVSPETEHKLTSETPVTAQSSIDSENVSEVKPSTERIIIAETEMVTEDLTYTTKVPDRLTTASETSQKTTTNMIIPDNTDKEENPEEESSTEKSKEPTTISSEPDSENINPVTSDGQITPEVFTPEPEITEVDLGTEPNRRTEYTTKKPEISSIKYEATTLQPTSEDIGTTVNELGVVTEQEIATKQPSSEHPTDAYETTDKVTSVTSMKEDTQQDDKEKETSTAKSDDENLTTSPELITEPSSTEKEILPDKSTETTPEIQDESNKQDEDINKLTTERYTPKDETTIVSETEKPTIPDEGIPVETKPETEKPIDVDLTKDTTAPEEEFLTVTSKPTTPKVETEASTHSEEFDKISTKPHDIPEETSSQASPEVPKPGFNDVQATDEVPGPEEESNFAPSATGGYGQEPDYEDENQPFGPGTCRYGGKVYVSAQQIPRDDPCDFCFCFRSDIICLQQSCPPPIHGCHEEPIQGFCCPRYECPVSMASTLNVTTTTTTTTTTLPPHFLPHAYQGAVQRRGCQIKGHTYKVGEVVRASSGPCLHCTCGGDGQMKCDPKACTPEPMLRQMIAAAVSAKRRR